MYLYQKKKIKKSDKYGFNASAAVWIQTNGIFKLKDVAVSSIERSY